MRGRFAAILLTAALALGLTGLITLTSAADSEDVPGWNRAAAGAYAAAMPGATIPAARNPSRPFTAWRRHDMMRAKQRLGETEWMGRHDLCS